MARGFESKSVADQQEAAMNPRPAGESRPIPNGAASSSRARTWRAVSKAATSSAHREMLQRALTDLDERLRRLAAVPPQE